MSNPEEEKQILKYFQINRLVDVQGLTGTGIIIDGVLVQKADLPSESTEGIVFFSFIPKNGSKATTSISTIESVLKYQCAGGNSEIIWLGQDDKKPTLNWPEHILKAIAANPCCFLY